MTTPDVAPVDHQSKLTPFDLMSLADKAELLGLALEGLIHIGEDTMLQPENLKPLVLLCQAIQDEAHEGEKTPPPGPAQ